MKTLALLHMLLLPLASLAPEAEIPMLAHVRAAEDATDAAARACGPYAGSRAGDVVISSQAQAAKSRWSRRLLGAPTVVQPGHSTTRLPKLRSVPSDLPTVHPGGQRAQILDACVPSLGEVGSRVALERQAIGADAPDAQRVSDAR